MANVYVTLENMIDEFNTSFIYKNILKNFLQIMFRKLLFLSTTIK
jgi:hypothetical protein